MSRLTWILALCLCLFSSVARTAEYDFRVLGRVKSTPCSTGECKGVLLECESPEKARYAASKFYTDAASFGEASRVEEGMLRLADGTYCRVSVDGNKVHILQSKNRDALRKAAEGTPPKLQDYPRWLDRFDNAAVAMSFYGWGDNPQDFRKDFAWARKYFRRFLGKTWEHNYAAPGVLGHATDDWWLHIGRKYDALVDLYHESTVSDKPLFPINVVPLPHIYRKNFLSTNTLFFSSIYTLLIDVDSTDRYEENALRLFAERMKKEDGYGSYFASPEVGRSGVPFLTTLSDSPEVKNAWHTYLRDVLHYSLADVGKKHFGNGKEFRSWDEVAVPTLRDFSGFRPGDCIDLKDDEWEFQADPAKDGEARKLFLPDAPGPWFPSNPGDQKLRLYTYWGRENYLWGRKTLNLTADECRKYKYLHQEQLFWHHPRQSLLKAYCNGKELKCVSKNKGASEDYERCYELDGLTPGKNTIVLQCYRLPAPGFLFAGPRDVFRYPGENACENRRYFDASEFSAWIRVQHVLKRMKAFYAGDPQGKPQLVMACDPVLDMLIPYLKKYGGFPHDTGMMGATFCPWTTTYGVPHGLPISGEPGVSPQNQEGFHRLTSLWLSLGVDSVNLLWNVRAYRDGDKGGNGRYLDAHREAFNCMGRMEHPEMKIGVMRSIRNTSRLNLQGGYNWDLTRGGLQAVGRRGQLLDPTDLVTGAADRYPVIIDACTELLTDEELAGIERYIRQGGTFIALHASGMHSPEKFASWPIGRLTGVKSRTYWKPDSKITFSKDQVLWPSLRGKSIPGKGYSYDWNHADLTGSSIAMTADRKDVRAVAVWADNPRDIAVAERRIGKGRIIMLGSTFWHESKDENGSWKPTEKSCAYLDELLTSLGVPRMSQVTPFSRQVFAEKWRSKNGLYDLYLIVRPAAKVPEESFDVTFFDSAPKKLYNFTDPAHPEVEFVRNADNSFTVKDRKLGAFDYCVLASPTADPENAALRWLESLDGRWRALPPLSEKEKAAYQDDKPSPWIIPLEKGWTAGRIGASDRRTVDLGLFATMGFEETDDVVFRKKVELPQSWRNRRLQLVFSADDWWYWGIVPAPEISVNGEVIPMDFQSERRSQSAWIKVPEDGVLNLQIALFCKDRKKFSRPAGVAGLFYLLSTPRPLKSMELDHWKGGSDYAAMKPVETGKPAEFRVLEHTFTIPEDWPKEKIFFEIDSKCSGLGYLEVNGFNVETAKAPFNQILISGMLKPHGQENTIRWAPQEPARSAFIPPDYIFRMDIPRARIAAWPDLPYAPGK